MSAACPHLGCACTCPTHGGDREDCQKDVLGRCFCHCHDRADDLTERHRERFGKAASERGTA